MTGREREAIREVHQQWTLASQTGAIPPGQVFQRQIHKGRRHRDGDDAASRCAPATPASGKRQDRCDGKPE